MLARANAWASAHGFDPISPATFHELSKERILPEAIRLGRGTGGGRGAAWGWSALSYRRLLKVWQLRAEGWRYRSAQRAALFILGADLDPELVRRDFIRLFERQARRTNREYGALSWRPGDPLPPKALAEVRTLIDSGGLQPFLDMVGLRVPANFADQFRAAVDSPGLSDVFEQVMAGVLTPPGFSTSRPLTKAMRHLPPEVASILSDDFDEWTSTLTGVLADPESGNAVVLAFEAIAPDDLVVLRDYTRDWPLMVKAIQTLLGALPDDDREGQTLQTCAFRANGPPIPG